MTPHLVAAAREAGFAEPKFEGEFRCSYDTLERFTEMMTAVLIRALTDLAREADRSLDMRPEFRVAIANAYNALRRAGA